MKGIILAGGSGTRLYPLTTSVSKQLLPVYDKPMIYYPLSTLIEGGIRDVLIITQAHNVQLFSRLLGEGEHLGMRISYALQDVPNGIAEALVIANDCEFWTTGPVTLILGDNIFDGQAFGSLLGHAERLATKKMTATVFLTQVSDPGRYGVASLDKLGNLVDINEKPEVPDSNFAVTGLYVYPTQAGKVAKHLQPSVARNELEITDVNRYFLRKGQLESIILRPGAAWLDAGTPADLLQASHYIQTVQDRQGRTVGCPELAALHQGWIGVGKLQQDLQARSGGYSRMVSQAAKLYEAAPTIVTLDAQKACW